MGATSEIQNSSYLDFTSYGFTNQNNVAAAYQLDPSQITALKPDDMIGLNVAIVLPRANDPTAPGGLLTQNWGTRQQQLVNLVNTNSLWSTYGTNQAAWQQVHDDIANNIGLPVLDQNNSNYISTAASQTIWVKLDRSRTSRTCSAPTSLSTTPTVTKASSTGTTPCRCRPRGTPRGFGSTLGIPRMA